MLPEHRRRQLLTYLKRHGAANVIDLSANLGVSEATVRRDLHELQQRGELERTHGGAVAPNVGTAFEPQYQEKTQRQAAAKSAIAHEAARFVKNGDVVILDSGSTTHALALVLRERSNLTVITSDIKIAYDLSSQPSIDVIVVGGRIRPELYSIIGHFAERNLEEVHANVAFVGADAISVRAGVTNATLDEVPIKRRVIRSAAITVLMADHTKFDKLSLARVAALSEFDHCITDGGIAAETLERYRAADLDVVIAKGPEHDGDGPELVGSETRKLPGGVCESVRASTPQ